MSGGHDVVVVGGGVVGAATALALRRAGFDVALVERGAPPADVYVGEEVDARVYAIAPGTVAFLKSLGAWKAIAAQKVSPYRHMQVWESDPSRSLHFDTQGSHAGQLGYIIEDRVLRSALWGALTGVAVHAGCGVDAFSMGKAAQLTLAGGRTLSASLVVSAEGAESRLREWAGIDTTGWEYPQRALVCHAGTQKPHRATAWQRFLPGGPLAFLPLADGRSSIVWSTREEHARKLLAMEDEEFARELESASQGVLGPVTSLTRRQSFPLRLLHAEQYVAEGLALVGDSAHVIHPLAGQGVNLGLADAAALVEVLAEARAAGRDWGLRVLKRYERRRKAENVEMLALTEGLFRLFGNETETVRRLREAGMFLLDRLDPLKRPLARRAMGL